jgi:hypothetical protein
VVSVVITFVASVADAFISCFLLFFATLVRRGKWAWSLPWNKRVAVLVIVVALLIQTVGEVVALNTDRWSYNQYMPLVPGLNVGLTPVLQMPLLILVTFWLAHRATCYVSERQGRG